MKLILFFNGWGVSKEIFSPLKTKNYDIKIVDLEESLDFEILEKYSEIFIIGWSFGVYHASKTFNSISNSKMEKKIKKTIAINGTSSAIHKKYGISPVIFNKTLVTLSESKYSEFMKNIGLKIEKSNDWKIHRDILENFSKQYNETPSIFEYSIISSKDRIFTSRCLLNFYKDSIYKIIECNHYPFERWNNWEEILDEF